MEKSTGDIFTGISAIIGSMIVGTVALVMIFSKEHADILPMIALSFMLLGVMLGYFASITIRASQRSTKQ